MQAFNRVAQEMKMFQPFLRFYLAVMLCGDKSVEIVFQPFLRFYAPNVQRGQDRAEAVSTLLEILLILSKNNEWVCVECGFNPS